MKKIYTILFIIVCAFNANAQCTSCTVTISSTDAANHIISSGQTYCITSTGTMSGLITISAGGTLCNQGNITSTNVWVAGGTLNNYGSINTNNLLVSAQGIFNNYQYANIDSLLITNIYSTLNNGGVLIDVRLGNSDASTITNNGDITADYVGDSAAQFNNNMNLKVNFDLYNAYNSGFFNSAPGYVDVDRDFYNSTGSTFQTDCMIPVGRDWFNSALVLGPPTGSCGGFAVVGQTLTSGTVGDLSTHIDICDAGSPALGFDGPGGTIATTTTHCTCTNNCTPTVIGISEPSAMSKVLINNLYPNPTKSTLTIELQNSEAESLTVEVMDMMGRKQMTSMVNANIGDNNTSLDVSKLAQGSYILNIADSHKLSTKKMFSVVK